MTAQVEVELRGVGDADVDGGAGGDVAAAAGLVLAVGTEQPGVVAFLHDDERDARLVAHFQLHARLAHRSQLVTQNLSPRKCVI